ncbi:DeoR/GlpR family DNA-binding transcription regulator [Gluconobacter sphaericus]|nr:DeoR/GlpR family DNA-binding transcription regulator [Gluconobacter sphaericus]MBS1085117.1 DeoR/GlpR transcriptional regulator [Gluconobacter sphaericus]MBS1097623.1 DeoR/GlpR transcriptional regulator [Gluconobacter sphaericus]MBS1099097.1 DeoR/GlpR transcriptional regulator [Gluconobacter sphaericus]QQX90822.1 DeoR/GlpR transcriptional regulator [Gluconobacter sphaericus]
MSHETLQTSPRQEQIVRLVRSQGYMANEDMAQHFGVAVQTIRRDVTYLAGLGLLSRHHGGATPVSTVENLDYDARQILNSASKTAIGRYAAALIPDRSSLFINIGTTTEAFARALTNHRDLRIVTNNLHVASLVSGRADFHTVLAGGQLRPRDGAILGATAIETLSSFRTEFGVIGISGIEEGGTLLDFDLSEIQCARTIIRHSRRVLLLADHTKFSRRPMGRVGNLEDIDDLITDRPVSEAFQRYLDAAGVTLHVAENNV